MEPTIVKPIPIFFLSLAIIFTVVSSFFLYRKNLPVHTASPIPTAVLSPLDTAKGILSGSLPVDSSADLTQCPTLPSSSYQIVSTRTDETGALSYITVSFSQPDGQRLYQLILLSSPPPWKLVACRDLGAPLLLQTP